MLRFGGVCLIVAPDKMSVEIAPLRLVQGKCAAVNAGRVPRRRFGWFWLAILAAVVSIVRAFSVENMPQSKLRSSAAPSKLNLLFDFDQLSAANSVLRIVLPYLRERFDEVTVKCALPSFPLLLSVLFSCFFLNPFRLHR